MTSPAVDTPVILRAEFTVEPFREGRIGPHVRAAVDAAERAGVDVEVGPFGNVIEAPAGAVADAVAAVVREAFAHGATRLSLQVSSLADTAVHPVVDALGPVVRAMGGRIVASEDAVPGDVAIRWEGDVVAAVRLPDLQGALDRLVDQVEVELGGSLGDLVREDKQRAARLLDERGAFQLRNSVDDIAERMGVSRVTLYSYLNAVRAETR